MRYPPNANGYKIYSKISMEEAVSEIIRGLDKIGCKVSLIRMGRPSLEDVY